MVGRYVLNIVYTPPNDVGTTLVDNEIVDLTDPDEYSYLIIGPLATAHQLRVKNVEITYGLGRESDDAPAARLSDRPRRDQRRGGRCVCDRNGR